MSFGAAIMHGLSDSLTILNFDTNDEMLKKLKHCTPQIDK